MIELVKPEDRPSLSELAGARTQGLACPECGCLDFRVATTWRNRDGTIRRQRKCRHCGYGVNTSERVEE